MRLSLGYYTGWGILVSTPNIGQVSLFYYFSHSSTLVGGGVTQF